ncbi:MAG: ABC transporter transmembrane domain-containing protein, partial [Alphaproteobacteria bacterium]
MTDATQSAAPPLASHKLFGRLMAEHMRPYIRRLIMAALCMAVVAGTTALMAWLLEPAIDKVFIARDEQMLWMVPLAVLAVVIVKGAATYGQNVLMSDVAQHILAEVQMRLYRRVITADLADLQKMHTGQLLSSFLYDVHLLREAVGRAVTGAVKDVLTVIALIAVMFIQDWKLALVATVVLPVAAVLLRRLGKRMRKASTQTQEETGKLSNHLTETLDGARMVKAYGMEDYEIARAKVAVDRRLVHIMKQIRTRAASAPATETITGVAVATAIFYGGWQAQSGTLTLGAFTSFMGAMMMAYQPIKSLASLHTALQEGLSAAQRIFAVIDLRNRVAEAADAAPLAIQSGAIRFREVSFHYGADRPALHGIDIEIPAGRRVALVGPSGAGKSTVLNLLLRFYDPDHGGIEIDGQDLRGLTLASLRGAMALVSQDIILFDDTARANIAYGKPDASDEEIVAAATAAGAHAFISALPQGYDTPLGEHGQTLSGGQRQRLAIARAMVRQAPILLLDEATSSLDSESEKQVQAALDRLMAGRTSLVIAHRLSTVLAA